VFGEAAIRQTSSLIIAAVAAKIRPKSRDTTEPPQRSAASAFSARGRKGGKNVTIFRPRSERATFEHATSITENDPPPLIPRTKRNGKHIMLRVADLRASCVYLAPRSLLGFATRAASNRPYRPHEPTRRGIARAVLLLLLLLLLMLMMLMQGHRSRRGLTSGAGRHPLEAPRQLEHFRAEGVKGRHGRGWRFALRQPEFVGVKGGQLGVGRRAGSVLRRAAAAGALAHEKPPPSASPLEPYAKITRINQLLRVGDLSLGFPLPFLEGGRILGEVAGVGASNGLLASRFPLVGQFREISLAD